jgi:hypothetical protein
LKSFVFIRDCPKHRPCLFCDPLAHAAAPAALFPDPNGAENFALAWWLWMDEMGKNMLKHYDAWREQHLGPAAKRPPGSR